MPCYLNINHADPENREEFSRPSAKCHPDPPALGEQDFDLTRVS